MKALPAELGASESRDIGPLTAMMDTILGFIMTLDGLSMNELGYGGGWIGVSGSPKHRKGNSGVNDALSAICRGST